MPCITHPVTPIESPGIFMAMIIVNLQRRLSNVIPLKDGLRWVLLFLLVCFLNGLATIPIYGQPKRPKYAVFQSPGTMEASLSAKLNSLKLAKKIYGKVKSDPKQYLEYFKNFENTKKTLGQFEDLSLVPDFLEKFNEGIDAGELKLDETKKAEWTKLVEKVKPEIEAKKIESNPSGTTETDNHSNEPVDSDVDNGSTQSGQFGQFQIQDMVEQFQDSPLFDYFRNSSAFRNTALELRSILQGSKEGKNGWVPKNLTLPKTGLGKYTSGINWPKVDMPKMSVLKHIRMPTMPSPKMSPSSTSMSSPGSFAMLVLALFVGAVTLWAIVFVWKRTIMRSNRSDGLIFADLAKVDLRRVSTREELVMAYHFLAVVLFGEQIRTRNHKDVVRRMQTLSSEDESRSEISRQLTDLYEQARYAPESEPMSADDINTARRHLCMLAGVSGS